VHDDAAAAEVAQSESARALTIGHHLIFGAGEYRPGTLEGDAILAHEIAHAEQQQRAQDSSVGSASEAHLERDADRSAVAALAGGNAAPAARSGLRLSRCNGKRKSAPAKTQVGTAGSATPDAAVEDWNFTPSEYLSLIQGKGQLQVAVDSGWFPPQLQANLLALLNYVLDPNLTPSSTAGVNMKDLYHGHVGIPRGTPVPEALRTRLRAFQSAEEQIQKAYPDVTAANLPAYKSETEQNLLPAAKLVLEEALKVPGAVVVYHTFEVSGPQMSPGDPRRNIRVPLSTNKPEHFTPPNPKIASSWSDNFYDVLQFSFLVDNTGSVHIRTGSTTQLSTVTGQPPAP
jgi:hypothetical protein